MAAALAERRGQDGLDTAVATPIGRGNRVTITIGSTAGATLVSIVDADCELVYDPNLSGDSLGVGGFSIDTNGEPWFDSQDPTHTPAQLTLSPAGVVALDA